MLNKIRKYQNEFLQYPQSSLPNHLNLIYQEGIRGNHIVFSVDDIALFDKININEICLANIEDHVIEFFLKCVFVPSVDNIKELINEFSPELRKQVYILYRSFLKSYALHYSSTLN